MPVYYSQNILLHTDHPSNYKEREMGRAITMTERGTEESCTKKKMYENLKK